LQVAAPYLVFAKTLTVGQCDNMTVRGGLSKGINRCNAISPKILAGYESNCYLYDLSASMPTGGLTKGRLFQLALNLAATHRDRKYI
jgi:hypothetical protein